jgi:F0F1-type ATP synthase membrane subunit b/b'
MVRLVPLAVLLALAACARQEEPVANRFDRTTAEIENKARELEAETENQVRAVEADIQNQIDALAANQANLAMPAETNAAAAPAANAAPGRRAR